MMLVSKLRTNIKKSPLLVGLIIVFVTAGFLNLFNPLLPSAHAAEPTEAQKQACYTKWNGRDVTQFNAFEGPEYNQTCAGWCKAGVNDHTISCPNPSSPSEGVEGKARLAETAPLLAITCGSVPTSGENAINAWMDCAAKVRDIYYSCSETGGGITGSGTDTPANTAKCATPKLNAIPGVTKVTVNAVQTAITNGRGAADAIISTDATAKAKKGCEEQGGTWANNECTPKSTDEGPVCAAGALGWILCPLSELMQNSTKLIAEQLQKYLTFEPIIGSDSGKAIQAVWQNLLVISNIALVIALIVVIYSQATSAGLSNYGVKKMLPRLLVVAILMNLSFFICAIAVDASNIAGASIKGLVDAGFAALPAPPAGTQVGASNAQTAVALVVGGISLVAVSAAGLLPLLFPVLLAAVLTLFAALAIVVFRQIAIVILIIVAPLAFAAYLLPNTESWFKKWQKSFTTLLFIYPIIMAIFYGSALVSRLIITTQTTNGAGAGIMTQIIALAVLIVPLFSLPFILKSAGGVLDRFGAMVNNRNKGFIDRARKKGQAMSANSNFQRARASRKAETTARRNREFYRRMSQDGFGVRKGMGQLGITGYGTQFATKGGRADVHMTGSNIADQARKQATEETARTLATVIEKGGFSPGSRYTVADKAGRALSVVDEKGKTKVVSDSDNMRDMVHAAIANPNSTLTIENAAGKKTTFNSGELRYALMSHTAKIGDVPLTNRIVDSGAQESADMREFISYNAGNYSAKAPSYVKGESGAFNNPRSQEIVGWHDEESKRAANYAQKHADAAQNMSKTVMQVLSSPSLSGQMAASSLENIMYVKNQDGTVALNTDGSKKTTNVYNSLSQQDRITVDNHISSGRDNGAVTAPAPTELRVEHTATPPGGTTPGGLYIPTAAESAQSPRPRPETPPPTGGGGSTPPPPAAPTSYTQGGAQVPGTVRPGDDADRYNDGMRR